MGLRSFTTAEPVCADALRDERWLARNLSELAAQYEKRWIAVLGERLVATGPTLGEVMDQTAREHHGSEPLFWFVEGDGHVYAG